MRVLRVRCTVLGAYAAGCFALRGTVLGASLRGASRFAAPCWALSRQGASRCRGRVLRSVLGSDVVACRFVGTEFLAENYFPLPCLLAVDAVAFRALRPWPLSRACCCFVRIKFVVVFNAAAARLDRRENKRSDRYRRS